MVLDPTFSSSILVYSTIRYPSSSRLGSLLLQHFSFSFGPFFPRDLGGLYLAYSTAMITARAIRDPPGVTTFFGETYLECKLNICVRVDGVERNTKKTNPSKTTLTNKSFYLPN